MNIKEQDIDLLFLIQQDCSATPGGRAGQYGVGGQGGAGGKGGKSFRYSVDVSDACVCRCVRLMTGCVTG